MDVLFFLRLRTNFIRKHYDACVDSFESIKANIERAEPPYDDPPYSEDGDPPFLEEWLEADASVQMVGIACVSFLADALKLYFNELERRIGFSLTEEERARSKRRGFVEVNREALGEIFVTDWSSDGIDFALIEQIVLARNRGQHGTSLVMMSVTHDEHTLRKHPQPLFASELDLQLLKESDDPANSFLMLSVEITRATLFAAASEVERLAEWIDANMDRAWAWRRRTRELREAAGS